MAGSSKKKVPQFSPVPRDIQQSLFDWLLTIGNPSWDVLLVGDGSGTGWDTGCGWACTLISRLHGYQRRVFWGAANCGSVNFAEAAPYLQALAWYDQAVGREFLHSHQQINCLIVTDSQITAQCGQAATRLDVQAGDLPRVNLSIWAAVRAYVSIGYAFQWHWQPREQSALNHLSDFVSKLSRVSLQNADLPYPPTANGVATAFAGISLTDADNPLDVYKFNPL